MKKPLVVLALFGGIGKRFWPLSTNKALFPFLGKPFIEFSVKKVLPKDCDRLVVVASGLNYRQISQIDFGVRTKIVVQKDSKGMADAIMTAKNEIKNSRLLVLIGDHLVETDLIRKVLDKARDSQAFGVLPGLKLDRYLPYGYLELDGQQIVGIAEKPGAGNEPSPYAYISGNYFEDSDALLSNMANVESTDDDIYEKTLSRMMKNNKFILEPYEGMSSALKYSWNMLDVTRDILSAYMENKRGRNVIIKSNVILEGPVQIGDNVRILENTKISGPCYIGSNTVIGNNNIIRQSHIGENCITGFNTDITRSYIGDNCWFHSNYIGDSVLEGNVSLGSGTVLANLRLDESEITSSINNQRIPTNFLKCGVVIGRNVRIGVNASIMPGKKIGSGTMIGAGACITRDIPDNSFCKTKISFEIEPLAGEVTDPQSREIFRNKL